MLACVNENTPQTFMKRNGDVVIFKNIKTRYSPNEVILVEYILGPKVVTSSRDYVGLYPRGWKSLKQFVAFEKTIIPPSDEPSLFRCIKFQPKYRVSSISSFQDYQFIYVTHTFQVIGSSAFFQFQPEAISNGTAPSVNNFQMNCHDHGNSYRHSFGQQSPTRDQSAVFINRALSSPSVKSHMDNMDLYTPLDTTSGGHAAADKTTLSETSPQFPIVNQFPTDNGSCPCLPLLTPEEIAYNQCFFVSENSESRNESSNVCFSESNNSMLLSEASNARPIPRSLAVQTIEPTVFESLKRGRPLVKTMDDSTLEICSASQSPPLFRRSRTGRSFCDSELQDNQTRDLHSNSSSSRNKTWALSNQWRNQSKSGIQPSLNLTSVLAPVSLENDGGGAVPKKCLKCRCPSDYPQLQRALEHQLKQAHEEIHDLKAHLDTLKHELDMARVGQAKQRLLKELVKHEAKDVTTFVNNLMASLVQNETLRIVNFDGTVMYVNRQIVSPGYLICKTMPKTLVYGRPANVKVVSPLQKEMKAIIGRQELKIRELQARLLVANAQQAQSSSRALHLNSHSSRLNSEHVSCSPQLTQPKSVEISVPQDMLSHSQSQTLNRLETPNSQKIQGEITSIADNQLGSSLGEHVTVAYAVLPADAAQFRNREVIPDEDSDEAFALEANDSSTIYEDSNNNNNIGSSENKCNLCGPDDEIHHIVGANKHRINQEPT